MPFIPIQLLYQLRMRVQEIIRLIMKILDYIPGKVDFKTAEIVAYTDLLQRTVEEGFIMQKHAKSLQRTFVIESVSQCNSYINFGSGLLGSAFSTERVVM